MADIVVDNVSKAYDGRAVLSSVCLRFSEGRVSGLAAPSGAGKTTLLRLMMGLEAPDSGHITGLKGARLGVCFQEDRLLEDADALNNLRLVRPDMDAAALTRALARFGLSDADRKPVRRLSGGMRRRVALLRALLCEADVLLLDEPFNGLDESTRDAVIRETLRLIAGRTAVVVAHDPEALRKMNADIHPL